jgi:hypothetical protein
MKGSFCKNCKNWRRDITGLYPNAGHCDAFSLAKQGCGDGGVEDGLIISDDLDAKLITNEYFTCGAHIEGGEK